MASLEDFKKRTDLIRQEVLKRLPDVATTLTLTAKAISERNIKDAGFGVLYSSNKVPAWFLHGKELNAKGTKFLADRGVNAAGEQGKPKKKRRKSKDDPDPGNFDPLTNWAEFRQAQGLQAAFVDLSYSNKMWANMQPVQIKTDGLVVMSLLGATNREAQNKMNWNRDRYGDFIRKSLTDDDGLVLTEVVVTELEKILDQFKL